LGAADEPEPELLADVPPGAAAPLLALLDPLFDPLFDPLQAARTSARAGASRADRISLELQACVIDACVIGPPAVCGYQAPDEFAVSRVLGTDSHCSRRSASMLIANHRMLMANHQVINSAIRSL
jgi:hypothetical protein